MGRADWAAVKPLLWVQEARLRSKPEGWASHRPTPGKSLCQAGRHSGKPGGQGARPGIGGVSGGELEKRKIQAPPVLSRRYVTAPC